MEIERLKTTIFALNQKIIVTEALQEEVEHLKQQLAEEKSVKSSFEKELSLTVTKIDS